MFLVWPMGKPTKTVDMRDKLRQGFKRNHDSQPQQLQRGSIKYDAVPVNRLCITFTLSIVCTTSLFLPFKMVCAGREQWHFILEQLISFMKICWEY